MAKRYAGASRTRAFLAPTKYWKIERTEKGTDRTATTLTSARELNKIRIE